MQAYCRVIPQGVLSDHVHIGRVISIKRRCGLATRLLHTGIKYAKDVFKAEKIFVEAQVYARKLYEKCGFVQISEEFIEDGIPHINMELCVNETEDFKMKKYDYVTLRERPELREKSAKWFSSKWGVPEEAYLECMDAYLSGETEYGWYICLDGDKIIGGLGVIENDFHDRKDLFPNVCAVYTEEEYRCQGVAGNLLNMVVDDMKSKGISPIYLLTDHTGFYERYGWEFFCMAQGDGEPEPARMYIHR